MRISDDLSDEQQHEFCMWTFGEPYSDGLRSLDGMYKWNNLHQKDLFLFPDGDIWEDTKKMLDLWRKSK